MRCSAPGRKTTTPEPWPRRLDVKARCNLDVKPRPLDARLHPSMLVFVCDHPRLHLGARRSMLDYPSNPRRTPSTDPSHPRQTAQTLDTASTDTRRIYKDLYRLTQQALNWSLTPYFSLHCHLEIALGQDFFSKKV